MDKITKRFWSKVDKSDNCGCWPWTAGKSSTGYGQFNINGRMRQAHRVVWELTNGSIPDDFYVCHHCDNRPCCNPGHLFLGTHRDNMEDMKNKGRARWAGLYGERHGMAKLDEADIHCIKFWLRKGYKQKDIAKAFGVTRPTIGAISTGRTWKHLQLRDEERTIK